MASGFWSQNPHVASWFDTLSAWWRSDPPRLLVAQQHPLRQQPVRGVVCRIATQEDWKLLPEFWYHWFSISSRCKCVVPLKAVQEAVAEKRWDIWVSVREDTGQLIGTLVRRHIKDLKIDAARWPTAGVVDYFCVHPAWRAKGVGRLLLTLLHNSTPAPIPPHLMFWEQAIRLDVPCFSAGIFWVKKIQPTQSMSWEPIQDTKDRDRLWSSCIPAGSVTANGGWKETRVWRGPEGSVAVWDTFHTTVPECERVGIVVGATSDQALTAFCNAGAGSFGVLLKPADSIHVPEGWEYDAPYVWFAYNTLLGLKPNSVIGSFPCLAF